MRTLSISLLLLAPFCGSAIHAEDDLARAEQEYAQQLEKLTTRYVSKLDSLRREMHTTLKNAETAARNRNDIITAEKIRARLLELDATEATPLPANAAAILEQAKPQPETVLTTTPAPHAKPVAAKADVLPPGPPEFVVEAPAAVPHELGRGLLVREYPRQDHQQVDEGTYVPLDKLGEPTKKAAVAKSFAKWRYAETRNGVAQGFLKVPKAGEYLFKARNFYDRNVLMINGRELCTYRDGEERAHRVALPAGHVPIAVIGYVSGRGSVQVSWLPPGETQFAPLPDDALYHNPAELPQTPAAKKNAETGNAFNPELKTEQF